MSGTMIALGVGLKLVQEAKAENAAAKRSAHLATATVMRDGNRQEVPVFKLVPGDIAVELAAGDMIPADVRIVAAKIYS